jgi:hypothetical protein
VYFRRRQGKIQRRGLWRSVALQFAHYDALSKLASRQGFLLVPRHPHAWLILHILGVAQQFHHMIEELSSAQLRREHQVLEDIPDASLCLVEEGSSGAWSITEGFAWPGLDVAVGWLSVLHRGNWVLCHGITCALCSRHLAPLRAGGNRRPLCLRAAVRFMRVPYWPYGLYL